jgi:hypothetical protein
MATTKPRITISLEPHVYEVLRRLSFAGGRPMSAAVTGFLDVALPALERMVVVMEAAKGMPQKARAELKASLDRAEAELLPAVAAVVDQSDMFLDEALTAARARNGAEVRGRSPRPKAVSTPVPVTRGSGRTKAAKKAVSHG